MTLAVPDATSNDEPLIDKEKSVHQQQLPLETLGPLSCQQLLTFIFSFCFFKQQLTLRQRPLWRGWPQLARTSISSKYHSVTSVQALSPFPLWALVSPPVQWVQQCLPDRSVGIS